MYRQCRLFSGEVEDYYCCTCRQPCSALALLVGPHTNHTRKRLDEAVQTIPEEVDREVREFRECVAAVHSELCAMEVRHEQRRAELENRLADIDRQMADLVHRRGEIAELLADTSDRDAGILFKSRDRGQQLSMVAHDLLDSIAEIKPLYELSETTWGMTTSGVAASLQDLRRCEDQLRGELGKLGELNSTIPPPPPQSNSLRPHDTVPHASSSVPPLHRSYVLAAADPQPRESRSSPSATSQQPHGGLNNSATSAQPQAQCCQDFEGYPGRAATPPPPAAATPPGPLSMTPPKAAPVYANYGGERGVDAGQPSAPVPVSRGLGDADVLFQRVLTNHEQHHRPAKSLSGRPFPTGRDNDDLANTGEGSPQPRSRGRSESAEILDFVVRSKETEISSSSSSSMEVSASTNNPRSAAHDTTLASTQRFAEVQHVAATGTADTTFEASCTYSSSTDATAARQRLAGRLLKQYRRIRCCVRDAVVQNQTKMVRTLVKTIRELRREAGAHFIDDLEKAIAADVEIRQLLESML